MSAILLGWAIGACSSDGGRSGSSDPAQELNASVKLPNEGDALDDPPTDESIAVSSADMSGSTGPDVVQPGDLLLVALRFEAPNGNVVGAGIRFGEDGPVRVIEIPDAKGLTEGILEFQVEVPASVCDDIARICHDVRCYEFAVTDIGAVSKANINDIGLVCGGCDEPSCVDLLDCATADTGESGSPGSEGGPPEPECSVSADCGLEPFSNGRLVCRSGACVDCEDDSQCEAGWQCVQGGCYEEHCEMYPVVPAAQLNQECACSSGTICRDSPDCAGLCFGGICLQECSFSTGEGYCTSICAEGTSCWKHSDAAENFCTE